MRSYPKIIIVQVGDNFTFTTSGGGTSWEYFELDRLTALRNVGPWLSSLRPHLKVKAITASSEFKLVFWWSVDGNDWSGPYDLHPAVSATGSTIQAAYSTTGNFGIQMRYGVGLRVTTGTETASVTFGGFIVAQTVV